MRGQRYEYILASTALALILAAPLGGVARDLDLIPGENATRLAAMPVIATPGKQGAMPAPAIAPPVVAPAATPANEPQVAPAGAADPGAATEQTTAPDPLASLAPADRAVAERIRDLLATQADKIFSDKKERAAAEAFYQNRNLKPLWLDAGAENARARSAIARLKSADADGLDPNEYKTPDFARLAPDGLAEAELQLTHSVLTYARHVQAGRFPYTRMSRNIELPQAPPDPAEILSSIAGTMDAGKTLNAYSPPQEQYRKLKAVLAELRSRPGAAKGEVARQIETVIVNMERWRWYPRELGASHVLVNQPDFTLSVMHNGVQMWTTRVVIGKLSKPTPLLSETMKYLTVNPTWHVPPSIVHNEYLPALAQDPTVLSRMGLHVSYHGSDVEITMPPGDNNALGRIRFSFPNRFMVYQHDTPDKFMFAHEVRAESHGCMRVQDPPKYAEVLLNIARPGEHWTAERIKSMYGRSEQDIHLEQAQIWVHLTYQTAFVDSAGKLQMRRDIYGLDGRTLSAIKRERGVVEPAQERKEEQVASSPSAGRKVVRSSHSSSPFQSSLYETPSDAPAYAPTYARPLPPRVIYR